MADQEPSDAHEPVASDVISLEIGRLLGLLKRLEHENTLLRRELASARPIAA